MFFVGFQTQFFGAIENPFSGETFSFDGLYQVNNGSYDGLGGFDVLAFTQASDFFSTRFGLGSSASNEIFQLSGGNDFLDFTSTISDLIVRGAGGNDVIWGGSGNDIIKGDDGEDSVHGGDGHDLVEGDSGDDILDGGNGADSVNGGSGNDFLRGGGNADTMNGGGGNDTLDGGAGGDELSGRNGNDTQTGGGGADTFLYVDANEGTDIITDFTQGEDIINLRLAGVTGLAGLGIDTATSPGDATLTFGTTQITLEQVSLSLNRIGIPI